MRASRWKPDPSARGRTSDGPGPGEVTAKCWQTKAAEQKRRRRRFSRRQHNQFQVTFPIKGRRSAPWARAKARWPVWSGKTWEIKEKRQRLFLSHTPEAHAPAEQPGHRSGRDGESSRVRTQSGSIHEAYWEIRGLGGDKARQPQRLHHAHWIYP